MPQDLTDDKLTSVQVIPKPMLTKFWDIIWDH